MSKFNSLITNRFKSGKAGKIHPLAERSSFSGVFQVVPITEHEEMTLKNILIEHQQESSPVAADLETLKAITSEVKAINTQAIILHGERIKRAQQILKRYRDGAFSAWLIETYGNRQTPYNFLQYYDLHSTLNKGLQQILDEMPRQAIYSLSSRDGTQADKEKFIKEYKGESKTELLSKLREKFPLPSKDKRRTNSGTNAISALTRTLRIMKDKKFAPSTKEKNELIKLAAILSEILDG